MIMRLCGILLLLVLLGIATATEEDLLELPELLQGQWRGQFVDHVSGTTYPVYLNFSTIMLDSEEEDSGILHTSVLKREESEPPMYRRIVSERLPFKVFLDSHVTETGFICRGNGLFSRQVRYQAPF